MEAHLAADLSNLTATTNMHEQYNATIDTIVDEVDSLTLVVNPSAVIRQTFTDTAAKQQYVEEALQSAVKTFRKVHTDKQTLDTAVNDRNRVAEQLNSAAIELKTLRKRSTDQEERIGLLTTTVKELEQAKLHEAHDNNHNLFGARYGRNGTRFSPIDLDEHDTSKTDRPQKLAADGEPDNDTEPDTQHTGDTSTDARTAMAKTSKDVSANVNADGGHDNDTAPDAQRKDGAKPGINSNSSKKRKSTASTKKTTMKRL